MKKTGAAKKKNGRRGRAKKVGPYNRDEWIAEQKEKNHNETIFEQKIDAAMEVSYGKQHRVTDFFGVVNLRDDCNIGEIKKQSLKKKIDSSSQKFNENGTEHVNNENKAPISSKPKAVNTADNEQSDDDSQLTVNVNFRPEFGDTRECESNNLMFNEHVDEDSIGTI